MPNQPQNNNEGTVETGVATLPAATRAPENVLAEAEAMQQPALSDEDLRKRQEALGTRRKPAGPLLEDGPGGAVVAAAALDQGAGVPETDVSETPEYDPENPTGGGAVAGANEPLESSER